MMTAAYTCPRRHAKSSTPTAVTSPSTRSGSARTMRSNVIRLACAHNRSASRACTPTQGQPDRLQQSVQQLTTPPVADREIIDLLDERLTRTRGSRAGETPDLQLDPHRLATDRGIGKRSHITAVHSLGPLTAVRAAGGTPASTRPDLDNTVHAGDPLDDHAAQMRQQDPAAFEVTCRP